MQAEKNIILAKKFNILLIGISKEIETLKNSYHIDKQPIMKKTSKISVAIYFMILQLLFMFTVESCKTEEEPPKIPVLTTTGLTEISTFRAKSGGVVISDGGFEVVAKGVVWSEKENPTVADNVSTDTIDNGDSFECFLSGLEANTKYYVRAFATTSAGTGYGNEFIFSTIKELPTVKDIDGNVYHVVQIGEQFWMVENLKTTRLNNGTNIPPLYDSAYWVSSKVPGYCWYNNNKADNGDTYGALYNWYTINTGKLAPAGWHIPTTEEWLELRNYVGEKYAGSYLRETGNTHWATIDDHGTNEYGFTALPGGLRLYNNTFDQLRWNGYWWTSSESTQIADHYAIVNISVYHTTFEIQDAVKNEGFSVRCIKD